MNQDKKTKLIMTLIAVGLIVVIVLICSVVLVNKKRQKQDTASLQQSIMDYADSQKEEQITQEETEKDALEESQTEPTATEGKTDKVSDNSLSATATPAKNAKDYSKVKYDAQAQLKELMEYWADNNQAAVNDLTALDRFKAMSYNIKDGEFIYYGDKDSSGNPQGKGVAVYSDNAYYYGDFSAGKKSGNGTWIHYHFDSDTNLKELYTSHFYTGVWSNDLPNGEGQEHYEIIMDRLEENVGYNTNLIGSYKNGLLNGDFYITNVYSDGNQKEWNAKASNGSFIYQNENKDTMGRRTVQVETDNPENYIWMLPKDNKNIGVQCLID